MNALVLFMYSLVIFVTIFNTYSALSGKRISQMHPFGNTFRRDQGIPQKELERNMRTCPRRLASSLRGSLELDILMGILEDPRISAFQRDAILLDILGDEPQCHKLSPTFQHLDSDRLRETVLLNHIFCSNRVMKAVSPKMIDLMIEMLSENVLMFSIMSEMGFTRFPRRLIQKHETNGVKALLNSKVLSREQFYKSLSVLIEGLSEDSKITIDPLGGVGATIIYISEAIITNPYITAENIHAFALGKYSWVRSIALKSPLITEEDKIVVALLNNAP